MISTLYIIMVICNCFVCIYLLQKQMLFIFLKIWCFYTGSYAEARQKLPEFQYTSDVNDNLIQADRHKRQRKEVDYGGDAETSSSEEDHLVKRHSSSSLLVDKTPSLLQLPAVPVGLAAKHSSSTSMLYF